MLLPSLPNRILELSVQIARLKKQFDRIILHWSTIFIKLRCMRLRRVVWSHLRKEETEETSQPVSSIQVHAWGGHRIFSYRCRVISYGCKLLYFRVIFRGWEWSHSIRSEILNRYWCPDFFKKKSWIFLWWIFQILGPDSHWKSTHCSKNILLLSIKNENIVMDPKHT